MIPAEEAGAEHGVGLVLQDRLEQPRQLGRVVLQVGVLDDDHVARGRRDPAPDAGALAPVLRVVHQDLDLARGLEVLEDGAGAVAGGVVDGDDLDVERHGAHLVDQRTDGGRLVKDRDDDGQLEIGGRVVVLAEALGLVAGGCRSATHVPAGTARHGRAAEIKSMG